MIVHEGKIPQDQKSLIETPAVAEILALGHVPVMTTQFIEYPATNIPADSTLKLEHVRFMLLYASQINPIFMREVPPLREIAAKRGELMKSWVAPMTDIGRRYDFPIDSLRPDTLMLFRLKE